MTLKLHRRAIDGGVHAGGHSGGAVGERNLRMGRWGVTSRGLMLLCWVRARRG